MPVVMDLEHVADEDQDLVEKVEDALDELLAHLTPERKAVLFHKLANALAYSRRTGETDRLEKFVESLLFTARMYRNPSHREAQRRVDALPTPKPGEGLDVGEYIAELERRHPRRAT